MKGRLILLGPPGSGKGTLAAQLQSNFKLEHVSSGHLLRREIESDSRMGRYVHAFLERGELVPDQVLLEFMAGWWNSLTPDSRFMLDGFPRTLFQAEQLDVHLREKKAEIESVLFLDCPVELSVERIGGRRSCPKCGRVYHLQHLPENLREQCEPCRVPLFHREDDQDSLVRKRYEIYRQETEPLVQYYQGQGKLTFIDGSQDSEKTFADTRLALARS